MPAYNADLEKFAGYDAQVVGISMDSVFSHLEWQKRDIGLLRYPLCSDAWPHAEVSRKYGVLREGPPVPGINERAVFLVDKQGKIAFSRLYELGQSPPNEHVLEALRKLQGG
jgi:alkyl hydroperoxide reductase subunit AhpC